LLYIIINYTCAVITPYLVSTLHKLLAIVLWTFYILFFP